VDVISLSDTIGKCSLISAPLARRPTGVTIRLNQKPGPITNYQLRVTTLPASLDPLTGAHTRAVFQRRLQRELKHAQRAQAPLALMLIDLDHFKSINDAFGHSRGDQVLATFAQRVAALLRSGDQLFRYGGDEFVLLLPNTDRPRALIAAERVLEAMTAVLFAGEPPLALTLSIGLAALPEDGPTAEALFEHADQRLYQAKRQGRQRVIAGEGAPLPSELEAGARLLERERALGSLREFLEAWPAARRGLLGVTGPRGAGAARFLAEAAQAARLRGYTVLALIGSPARKARLFGALAEARLEGEGPLDPQGVLAGSDEPGREVALPMRLRQFLAQRAQAGLVITARGLADLDRGTLEVLTELWTAPELPAVALIYSGLDEALPGRGFEAPLQAHAELTGLSPAGLRVWLRGRLQWEAPEDFCAWLHRQTGGLPGLLQRAVSYLIEQGGLRAVGEGWALDPNLAALPLRERLDQLLDPPTNLPAAANLFVGRQAELRALKQRLAQPAERLVVLVGPGGIGKSRLALQAAAELRLQFADGVFVVPLAPVISGQFLVPAIAQALRLPFQGSAEPAAQLAAFLRDKRLLLVLENFELLPAAGRSGQALINRLLEQAPQVRLLVTSRERLGLTGESVLELRGLPVPPEPADGARAPAAAEAYSAAQLFLQTARRVAPDFALTAGNGAAVLRICQLVEGLPLGIELAAAWAALLDCHEIAAQIERNLDFLDPAPAGTPQPLQSARAVLDYFWGLLSSDEQRVMRQLSVFRGGFPREAAGAVAGASLFFLAALVDRAFLTRTPAGRYQPHELLRRYAADRLALDGGELAAAQARHAAYYAALAEQADPELTGARQSEWLERLEQENDNLRAALEWSLGMPEAGAAVDQPAAADQPAVGDAPALRLALGLWRFWWVRGYLSEGRRWLELALAQQPPGPPGRRARAMQRLGILARGQGELALARQQLEASLSLFEDIGDRAGAGDVHNSLGLLALNQDDLVNARQSFERSLALERETGDRQRLAVSLNNLGGIALQQGDPAAARGLFTESLALRRAVGDQWGIANSLLNLSEAAYDQGAYAEALALCSESLLLRRELGDQPGLALCLEGAARAWAAQGRPEVAAVLLGGAERLRETLGAPVPPSARRVYQQALAAAQAALGEAAFAATRAGGRSLSLAQLAEQARSKNFGESVSV
jgi:diguanylate cyclase (GGDEF)-like protein